MRVRGDTVPPAAAGRNSQSAEGGRGPVTGLLCGRAGHRGAWPGPGNASHSTRAGRTSLPGATAFRGPPPVPCGWRLRARGRALSPRFVAPGPSPLGGRSAAPAVPRRPVLPDPVCSCRCSCPGYGLSVVTVSRGSVLWSRSCGRPFLSSLLCARPSLSDQRRGPRAHTAVRCASADPLDPSRAPKARVSPLGPRVCVSVGSRFL